MALSGHRLRTATGARPGGGWWSAAISTTSFALAVLCLRGASAGGGATAACPFEAVPVSTVATRRGDLELLVAHLAVLMPAKDSGLYRHPAAREATRSRSGVALAYRVGCRTPLASPHRSATGSRAQPSCWATAAPRTSALGEIEPHKLLGVMTVGLDPVARTDRYQRRAITSHATPRRPCSRSKSKPHGPAT